MNDRAPFFVTGFYQGFQLYIVFTLISEQIDKMGPAVIDLVLFSGYLIALSTQLHLGRSLARMPATIALRDSMIAGGAGFMVYVMAPIQLWIILAFIAWFLTMTSIQITTGRIILMISDMSTRVGRLNLSMLGLISGIIAAKAIPFAGFSPEWLINTGMVLTILSLAYIHDYARRTAGYATSGQAWILRDLTNDPRGQALIAVSACFGALITGLIFEKVHISHAGSAVLLYLLLAKKIFTVMQAERAVRIALYCSALSLFFDLILHDSLVSGSWVLAFSAALIYGAVRIGAYCPALVISTAERISLHNWGAIGGVILVSISYYLQLEFYQRFWSLGFLLMVSAYLLSFVRPATGER